MDNVQSILNNILFMDKFPPPNTATSTDAVAIHNAFWGDSHNRNLSLEHVEIELRLGKLPSSGRGPFDAGVPQRQFQLYAAGLQGFGGWDDHSYRKDVIGYYPNIDSSIRLIQGKDGVTVISKQKLVQADFVCANSSSDLRLAVSAEIPLQDVSKYTLDTATRTVTRERYSYTLKSIRYDLSIVHNTDGTKEYHIELEIVNPSLIQRTHENALTLTKDVYASVRDLFNIIEPTTAVDLKLLRRRMF